MTTDTALAIRLDIPRGTLGAWRTRTRIPLDATIAACKKLGLTFDPLTGVIGTALPAERLDDQTNEGLGLPIRWGNSFIRSPREIADRIPVPVVEVAGGPNGMEAIDEATIRVDYYTPSQWTAAFGASPDAAGSGRFILAHLRGESMVPRYYDRQEVPIELFERPATDTAGGDVFLVRLDGHLYLKLVSRRPAMGGEIARIALRSLNELYDPIVVPLYEDIDFAVLGRIVESNRDRLFAALAGRAFNLNP